MNTLLIVAAVLAGGGGIVWVLRSFQKWGVAQAEAERLERDIERLEREKEVLELQRDIANRPNRPVRNVVDRMRDGKI